ncbi:MAG: leucine-rich repeat protein [Firmicutes bacterium]|nr:leucine-rich repeat protein [Bacillota bacterium]
MKKVFLASIFALVLLVGGIILMKPSHQVSGIMADNGPSIVHAYLPEHFITTVAGFGPATHRRVIGLDPTIRDTQDVVINVNIPSHIDDIPVTVIVADAFANRPDNDNQGNIIGLTLPNTITSIEITAFLNNMISGTVVIPDSVVSISNNAFQNNMIENLTLPSNPDFHNIPSNAFSFNRISSITIPDNIRIIGAAAFYNNPLASVVLPNNQYFTVINSHSFAQTAARSGVLTSVVIPDTVTIIGPNAFQNNQLESVVIPNTVTSIGAIAFHNNNINNLVIPSSVDSIGANAFNGNNMITAVIPSSVTSMGGNAFAGNPNLTIFSQFQEPPAATWAANWNPHNSPVIWNAVPTPTITVTNTGGTQISDQTINWAENALLTITNPNGISEILINGQSLTSLTGTLTNNSARWERGEFIVDNVFQTTVTLDLTLVGHNLDIEIRFPTFEITTAVNPSNRNPGSVSATGTYTNLDNLPMNSTRQLTASPSTGWRFTHWTASVGVTIANYQNATTNFTIPATNATITAHFQAYVIVDGESQDITQDKYEVGHLEAPTPPQYHIFMGWALYGTTNILNDDFELLPGQEFTPIFFGYITVNGEQILITDTVYQISHLSNPAQRSGYTFRGWRLGAGGPILSANFEFEPGMIFVPVFEANPNNFIWILIGSIAGVLLLIALLIFILRRRNNKKA